MASTFDRGLRWVLKAEGGYYDGTGAHDSNPTNFGITQRTFDAYRASLKPKQPKLPVKKITLDEVESIYRILYWTKGKCDKIAEKSETLAIIHLDACVNHGVASPNSDRSAGAVELLQRALGVKDDGIFGPITWQNLVNELMEDGEEKLAKRYLKVREAQYRHLAEKAPRTLGLNLTGWLRRLEKLALHLGLT